jgi:NodT family efflux transporter outer membrane factor (OMF) lipoprotein
MKHLHRSFACLLRNSGQRLRLLILCGSLIAGLLLVAACSSVPAPKSVPVELPAQFSASGGQKLPGQWWQTFDDQVLDGLMTRALTGNLSLMTAWDRLSQAQAVARIVGAELSPTLDGEAGAARNWFRENGQTDNRNSYRLGLVAGYEVDLWGRIRSRRDAAVLDAVASEEELKAAALTLSAQVATTWYQLVEQYGQARILEQQITINSKVLDLISLQFRTGQVGIADVLQQRQLIETNRGELARIRSRAQVLENQLAVLLGLPPDRSAVPLIEEIGALPPLPATGVPADLIQRRPDIRAAWIRLQAADQRLAAAVADRFPRLSLSGQLSTEGDQVGDLFDNWLASLAGNLVGPLVDGGRRQAEVERSQAVVAEQLHSYGQVVLDALAEVENALVRERQQLQYIDNLERQQLLAEQAIVRIRDRYIKGGEDYQRVLTALLSLQNVQRNRLTAQLELYEFRIQLCRALAGGWQLQQPAG